ncbi:MAG: hypothetical protein RL227_334 [Pseudomonadota bacterium]|jgi:hypothetical protein
MNPHPPASRIRSLELTEHYTGLAGLFLSTVLICSPWARTVVPFVAFASLMLTFCSTSILRAHYLGQLNLTIAEAIQRGHQEPLWKAISGLLGCIVMVLYTLD